jgi:hypothetical protein
MPPISYFNRVKIISLLETDVSEARVATQLGFPKSWQESWQDKTRQIEFIRAVSVASKDDLDDQNLLLATVQIMVQINLGGSWLVFKTLLH